MLRQQYNPGTWGQQILKDMLLNRTIESVNIFYLVQLVIFKGIPQRECQVNSGSVKKIPIFG